MNVFSFPGGFSLEDDDISQRFTRDCLSSLNCEGDLYDFVRRWQSVWSLGKDRKPSHVVQIDEEIANLRVDWREALRCIRRIRQMRGLCKHAPRGLTSKRKRARKHARKYGVSILCQGCEIRMPFTLLQASLISHRFEVPQGVAWHQAFCPGPHDGCF